jgi:hypothetical protein
VRERERESEAACRRGQETLSAETWERVTMRSAAKASLLVDHGQVAQSLICACCLHRDVRKTDKLKVSYFHDVQRVVLLAG